MRSIRRPIGITLALLFAGACSSNLQSSPPDGGDTGMLPEDGGTADGLVSDGPVSDGPVSDGPTDAGPDADFCAAIQQAYADVLTKAQECTVGAADQCGIQVQSGFWCACTTFVNGNTDTLAALVSEWVSASCRNMCNGTCAQPRALVCATDATSSTGGRCQLAALLSLSGTNDGETFSVPVGYEIDTLLQNIGPNGYGNDVVLSSDAATILDVTIPAGPVNPGGPMHLYRLRAVSAGEVVVQIPYVSAIGDASVPAYTITLEIH
jgi:hypothetical protein